MRIRFKSDSAEEEKEKKSDEVPTDAAATPSTADVDSSAVSRDTTEVESESRAETDTLVGEESSPAKEGQSKERAAHLTGKINNLLTGDLTTITESFNAVAIRELSLYLNIIWTDLMKCSRRICAACPVDCFSV